MHGWFGGTTNRLVVIRAAWPRLILATQIEGFPLGCVCIVAVCQLGVRNLSAQSHAKE